MSLLIFLIGYFLISRISTVLGLVTMAIGVFIAASKEKEGRGVPDKITVVLSIIYVIFFTFIFAMFLLFGGDNQVKSIIYDTSMDVKKHYYSEKDKANLSLPFKVKFDENKNSQNIDVPNYKNNKIVGGTITMTSDSELVYKDLKVKTRSGTYICQGTYRNGLDCKRKWF